MTKSTKAKANKSAPSKFRTKTEQVVSLLSRPSGASIAEIMKSTGWQAHSIRGFLAGSLKKKGHAVSSDVEAGGVRRYWLPAGQAET